MHQVERVEVEGFWDTHNLKVNLHRDVTFFIGSNGTGKTTLLNLIAAVLTGDFLTLERTPFKRVVITLTSTEAARSPSIVVTKVRKKERSVELIEYRIKKDANAAESRHSMEELEDMAARRAEMSRRYIADFYRRLASRFFYHLFVQLVGAHDPAIKVSYDLFMRFMVSESIETMKQGGSADKAAYFQSLAPSFA